MFGHPHSETHALMSIARLGKSLGPTFVATILAVGGANLCCEAAAQSAPPAAGSGYHPTVADLMNALIQPRHAKLGLAGEAGNWPLAAYALFELNQGFKSVGQSWPTWRRLSLPDMIETLIAGPTKTLDQAIKARDAAQFASAYQQLTQACNSCHSAVGHEFIVIKAPDLSSFTNQNFTPAKK
jgi:hypothetical protein